MFSTANLLQSSRILAVEVWLNFSVPSLLDLMLDRLAMAVPTRNIRREIARGPAAFALKHRGANAYGNGHIL